MPSPTQQHPRDIIRNALAAQQHQPASPINGYHICFMMLSIITASIILIYQIQTIMSDNNEDKSFDTHNKASSIRYLNNINDIKGYYYYDYIIIGAGTAGCVLASKLSYSHNIYPRILVIESSKSMHSLMQNKDNKVTSFNYISKNDILQIESINKHNTWIKSSSKKHANNMWSIGHPSDYNKLWNINITNWKYDDILPYFQASETVIIDEIINEFGIQITDKNELKLLKQKRQKMKSNAMIATLFSMLPIGANSDLFSDKNFDFGDLDITKNRGNNGKLVIKQARKYSIVNAFIVNALNAGYKYNIDHNSFFNYNSDENNDMVNTVSYQQYNKHGIFEAYIDKLKKSNFATNHKQITLDILFDTKVKKILFHSTQNTNDGKHIAIGVEVINNATNHKIFLRDDMLRNNEIILSAGTVNSPRLLMQSGFGDKNYLKRYDIDTIEHNPEIGHNLQDQIKFSVYFKHNDKFKVISKSEITKWKYKLFGGTMVNSSGYDANIFYNPLSENDENDENDVVKLQFMLYNGIKPINIYNLKNEQCINTEILDGITIDIILLHPKSIGFVNLESISPNYLSDEYNQDLELLLKGYREIEKIFFNKKPFDGVVTFGHFWPCNKIDNDDESIKKYILNNVHTHNNQIGTNKMGVVVDDTFILNNTLNVRVIDGSVMPQLISGSVQAPIVMMAEKACDIIVKKRLVKQQQFDDTYSTLDHSVDDDDDIPIHSEL